MPRASKEALDLFGAAESLMYVIGVEAIKEELNLAAMLSAAGAEHVEHAWVATGSRF